MLLLFTIELSLKLILIVGAGCLSIVVLWGEKRQKRNRFAAQFKKLPKYTRISMAATALAMVIAVWSELANAYREQQAEQKSSAEFTENIAKLDSITSRLVAVDRQSRRLEHPMSSLVFRVYMSFAFASGTDSIPLFPELTPLQKDHLSLGHEMMLFNDFTAIRDTQFVKAHPKLMRLGWQVFPEVSFLTQRGEAIARYVFPISDEMPGRLLGIELTDSIVRVAFDAYCGYYDGLIPLNKLSLDDLNGSTMEFKSDDGIIKHLMKNGGVPVESSFELFIRWPGQNEEIALDRRGSWKASSTEEPVCVRIADVGVLRDSLRHEQGPLFRF